MSFSDFDEDEILENFSFPVPLGYCYDGYFIGITKDGNYTISCSEGIYKQSSCPGVSDKCPNCCRLEIYSI